MRRLPLALAVVTLGTVAVAAPQTNDTQAILARATAYVEAFIARFADVVADEEYVQTSSTLPRSTGTGFDQTVADPTPERRVLKSEFLLVRLESTPNWYAFRDVMTVDGKPVRDRNRRLMALLQQPTANRIEEAQRIADESSRFNMVGPGRTINTPLMTVAFLQPAFQGRFRFTPGRRERGMPDSVVGLEFKETAHPTILRWQDNRDLPVSGRVWIEASSGRVMKTELNVGISDRIVTTFRYDERLQLAVPAEMRESYRVGRTAFEGKATYGQFRRFGVTTEVLPGQGLGIRD